MKIREGFVSNSSTTSFCIYGLYLDSEAIREKFNLDTEADLYDELETKFGSDVSLNFDPYDDGCWIGLDWPTIRDYETGAEFKQRVKYIFDKVGITDELGTHQEAWHD